MVQITLQGKQADEKVLAEVMAKLKGEVIAPCEIENTEIKKEVHERVFSAKMEDIEGQITIKTKEAAIMFIIGVMETFDIDATELDY